MLIVIFGVEALGNAGMSACVLAQYAWVFSCAHGSGGKRWQHSPEPCGLPISVVYAVRIGAVTDVSKRQSFNNPARLQEARL